MSKVYAIILDLKNIFHNYDDLYEELQNSPSWWHYIKSTWLIRTEETSNQIWNRIQNHITPKDFALIIEVNKDYQGWLPQEAWDWINETFYGPKRPDPKVKNGN